ncbi:hypothetical protein DW322_11765 [Rhodococcus rhodnii]|uniref:Alpha/beta-hydrolase catalytic domain-containing protein n=1 Tax=Rhodococcus rhodnii TaxID=38312 RepID=A0A6P2CDE0_9NOCA|nr:hypothetical protein DW322_11765 [Rhodococcus rhodnii]
MTTSLAAAAALATALAPSMLPRPAIVEGILLALALVVAFAVSAVARRVVTTTPPQGLRFAVAVVALAVVTISAARAVRWHNGLRSAMEMPAAGAAHWLVAAATAGAVTALALGAARAATSLVRRWGAVRAVAVAAATSVVVAIVGAPTAVSANPANAAAAEAASTYVALAEAPTASTRASLAVDELERSGALERSAIVVAVPTGSGWIDAAALAGIRQRFGGDVAVVATQYTDTPSWYSFLTQRDSAEKSARAVLDAVAARLRLLPVASRPSLHVYGQSLGALGGARAVASSPYRADVCSAVWVGPPPGTPLSSGTVLANGSDPVPVWSADLLVRPPDAAATTHDAPAPQWIPVVSFVQTTVDLLVSLNVPAGHGHRYDERQGTAMAECRRDALPSQQSDVVQSAGAAIGPRATSYAAPTR